MDEIWKPVVGRFANAYEVSNIGRVRRRDTQREVAQQPNNGYRYVSLYLPFARQNASVHRLVAFAFIPLIKGKNCVDHINECRHDNRVENLRWCTHAENMFFARRRIRLTRCRGEGSGRSKLAAGQVQFIRLNWSTTTAVGLAEATGVSHTSIGNIMSGRTWLHITPSEAEARNMEIFKLGYRRGTRARKTALLLTEMPLSEPIPE